MKINAITFGEDDRPVTVTATFMIKEAAAIAAVFGKMNGHAHTRLGGDAYDVYSALTSMVFNTFWEDGVDDACRDLGIDRTFTLKTLNADPNMPTDTP